MKKLQKLDFSKFRFCPARGDIFKMRPAEFMVWCGSNTWASKNRKTSSRCITRPSSGVWGSGFSYQMGVGHIIWSGLHNLIEKKMLYSIWTFPAESVTILSVPCGRFSFVPQGSMKGKVKSIMKLKRNLFQVWIFRNG